MVSTSRNQCPVCASYRQLGSVTNGPNVSDERTIAGG
jgi:hypothetical protein